MMSESQYKKLTSPEKSLNDAILTWRNQLGNDLDVGFNEEELKTVRGKSVGREFSWDE